MRKELPPTWWFRLARRIIPSRCREIPEATAPNLVLLRQVAIVKEHVYLQQFAGCESPMWLHSHPWERGTIAIGLWGWLEETRDGFVPGRAGRAEFRAPYLRYMDPGHRHRTSDVSRGHTSIFIGLGRKTDDKYYFGPHGVVRHWSTHIRRRVARL